MITFVHQKRGPPGKIMAPMYRGGGGTPSPRIDPIHICTFMLGDITDFILVKQMFNSLESLS
jgi:hypothetical protein